MTILVDWFDVFVQKDDPDHGADPDTGFHRGEGFPQMLNDVEHLDKVLSDRGLPPIAEWDENEDDPGKYHTNTSEDGEGLPITDAEYRANPERGLFLVDYALALSVAEPRPLTTADLKEIADA